KYRPDMVITMMGINDRSSDIIDFQAKKYTEEKSEESLFMKLLSLFSPKKFPSQKDDVGLSESCPLPEKDDSMISGMSPEEILRCGNYFYETGSIGPAKGTFEFLIAQSPENSEALFRLGMIEKELGNYPRSEELLKRSLLAEDYDAGTYLELGYIYRVLGRYSESEKMFMEYINRSKSPDKGYAELGILFFLSGDFRTSEEMIDSALNLNPENDQALIYHQKLAHPQDNISAYEFTKTNYNSIYFTLEKNNIRYAAMQYPTLKSDKLKELFSENDQQKILFISNFDNFKKGLEEKEYQALFVDRCATGINHALFRGEFGHCTAEGNRLIAESAADTILE
ncbi:hypothetical protein JXC34_04920, partial [Candidatus Woesearchaeota archaeon]|nr:hypothetical protein [Candidatus Woesearchaeota archaeon]